MPALVSPPEPSPCPPGTRVTHSGEKPTHFEPFKNANIDIQNKLEKVLVETLKLFFLQQNTFKQLNKNSTRVNRADKAYRADNAPIA